MLSRINDVFWAVALSVVYVVFGLLPGKRELAPDPVSETGEVLPPSYCDLEEC